MNINNLDITRRIVQIATILTVVSCGLLGIIAPYRLEQVIRDYGNFYSSTWEASFDIYLAIAFFLPVIGSLVTNGSLKRYYKRRKAENFTPIRVSPTETVLIAQNNSKKQRTQQIGVINIRHCVICGLPNDYDSKFCKYCGNQL